MVAKLYLPHSDNFHNLTSDSFFPIRFSHNGMSIFLNEFGYEGIHLTLYIKNVDAEKGKFTLNIHLTKEGQTENENIKLKEYEKDIYPEKIEQFFLEKKEKISKIYQEHYDSLKKMYDPEEIICCQCLGIDFDLNFKKRKQAIDSIKKLSTIEMTEEQKEQFSACKKNKHNPHFHLTKEIILYRFLDKFYTEKEAQNLNKSLEKEILIDIYNIIESEMNPLKKEFQKEMKKYQIKK
jgi:hypothetical protein